MSPSTASTGSKRRAVDEDEASHHTEETRDSKRVKPARKNTTSNGEQDISKYFTRNESKDKIISPSLDSKTPVNRSSSPKVSPIKRSSQRKNDSISPPPSSRRTKSASVSDSKITNSKKPLQNLENKTDTASSFQITEHIGDIFNAPANSLLIHACNCKGAWGTGIAEAFRKIYPKAYRIYQAHCRKLPEKELVGTALLIPPQRDERRGQQHFVGCVFTSVAYGARVDPPHKILQATAPAMTDLFAQARKHISDGKGDVSDVRICKINSGRFNVEWEETLEVLKDQVEPHGFEALEVWSISSG